MKPTLSSWQCPPYTALVTDLYQDPPFCLSEKPVSLGALEIAWSPIPSLCMAQSEQLLGNAPRDLGQGGSSSSSILAEPKCRIKSIVIHCFYVLLQPVALAKETSFLAAFLLHILQAFAASNSFRRGFLQPANALFELSYLPVHRVWQPVPMWNHNRSFSLVQGDLFFNISWQENLHGDRDERIIMPECESPRVADITGV